MLERLRAALPREPLLVVPTAADADALRSASSRRRASCSAREVVDLRAADARARAPRPGVAGRAARPRSRASASCARRSRDAPSCSALAALRRGARLRRRAGGRCSRSCSARSSTPRALHRARCAPGRGGRRRAHAERAGGALLRLPPPARARSGAVDARRATPARRSTRCAQRPAAWGGRPVFLYGFDDLTPLQLDAVETLVGRAERRRLRRAALRAGPRRVRRPRGDGRAAARRSPPSTSQLPERSEHYAPARAAGAAPPRARAVRARRRAACRRTARCGCSRRAASAPRPSSSAPRCSS